MRALQRSAALESLPRDIVVHVLARLAPLAVVQFVRANRALYGIYGNEWRVWGEVAKTLQRSADGMRRAIRYAPAIVQRWPALAERLPMRLAKSTKLFAISSDHTRIAYGNERVIRIAPFTTTALVPAVTIQLEVHNASVVRIRISPSGAMVACTELHG